MMLQGKQATIRGLLFNNYTDILVKARKSVKGLRMQYITTCMIVGDISGCRCIEFSSNTGKTLHNSYQILLRAIKAGYVYKDAKRYYLTDKGATVYATICAEFDASMNEIIKVLVEEARSRI